jgi:hypothetical protein
MEQQQAALNLDKVQISINRLREKRSRIYLFVQDTKGNARGSVRYIYQMAMALKNGGFNPIILHEKNDYTGVGKWLGEKYMTELPHKSIENQNLEISPEDFIIVPEIFGYILSQIKNLPAGKIVLAQSYSSVLETLQPGETWLQFGITKCITTSQKQKEYIETIMRSISFDIVQPVISDTFQKSKLPAKTIVAIHTRDQRDTINLIKTFYLKYPQFRWITFRDMRGLSEVEFANTLKDCCLSVWIDPESGFGTFPLESMKAGVPVIGKVPDLIPEWLTENNGVWLAEKNVIVDYVSDFIQAWLEDNLSEDMMKHMEETSSKYTDIKAFEETVCALFADYQSKRANSFETQLKKLTNN